MSILLLGCRNRGEPDIALSIGTNDAAPWRGVSLDAYARAFGCLHDELEASPMTYVAPPGFRARLSTNAKWSNSIIDSYRDAALDVCSRRGVSIIRTDRLVQSLGSDASAQDGVHLSGVGYRALTSVLVATVAA